MYSQATPGMMMRKPAMRPQQGGGMTSRPNPGMGRGGGIAARPPQGIDGAIQSQMNNYLTGGMQKPMGAAIPRQRIQALNAPQPAWQQLAGMGIGGQGSAVANKEKLAQMQQQGSGGIVAPGMAGAETMTKGGAPGFTATPGPFEQQAQQAGGAAPAGGQPSPFMKQMDYQVNGGDAAPGVHDELLKKMWGGGMGGGIAAPYGG